LYEARSFSPGFILWSSSSSFGLNSGGDAVSAERFMNKLRKFWAALRTNGKLEIHRSSLNVVLHDKSEAGTGST
jgi:hypothetical protein